MLREGKGMGNLRLVIPGIPGIPGNHIKSKVKFNISFIFMPWPAIRQTANNDSISRPNSRPKLTFSKNGKGCYKMPREIWGLFFPGITENGNSRSPLPCAQCTMFMFLLLKEWWLWVLGTTLPFFSARISFLWLDCFCPTCRSFSLTSLVFSYIVLSNPKNYWGVNTSLSGLESKAQILLLKTLNLEQI